MRPVVLLFSLLNAHVVLAAAPQLRVLGSWHSAPPLFPGAPPLHVLATADSVGIESVLAPAPVHGGEELAVLCALDGVISDGQCVPGRCTCTWPEAQPGPHIAAMYLVLDQLSEVPAAAAAKVKYRPMSVSLLGVPVSLLVPPTDAIASVAVAAPPPAARAAPATPAVGVYYTTLNQPDTSFIRNISAYLGRPAPTMEDMLRSGGAMSFADVALKFMPLLNSSWCTPAYCNWYQSQPALGYYGLYRKRASEAAGILPDFPDTAATAAARAAMLVTAGVDYIVFDATNWGAWPDAEGDVRQMRPAEVLLEEWAALRARGTATPRAIVWNVVGPGHTMWQAYLDNIYNNAAFADVLYTSPLTGRRVFFVVDSVTLNETAVAQIAYNGGRRDIDVVRAWLPPSPYNASWYDSGVWSYLAQCVGQPEGGGAPDFTTTVPWDGRCGHPPVRNSPLGTAYTVSANNAIDNLPLASPGKQAGLWLIKTFEDVFRLLSLEEGGEGGDEGAALDHVFLPSFNEYQIAPMNMSSWGINNSHFHSAGALDDDPDARMLFLDGFGDQRNRVLEPSVHDGGYTLALLASCVRVMRLLAALRPARRAVPQPGAPYQPCAVAGEACCAVTAPQQFAHVWSLARRSGGGDGGAPLIDTFLSNDAAEVHAVLAGAGGSGSGWAEVCNPWGGPTLVCANASAPWHPWDNFEVVRGPFRLLANGTAQAALPGVAPLYRCAVPPAGSGGGYAYAYARHLFDTSRACAGVAGAVAELLLGHVALAQSSDFPRPLRRCFGGPPGAEAWFHTVDGACEHADETQDLLGFVA